MFQEYNLGMRLALVFLTTLGALAQPIILKTTTILDGKGGVRKNQQIVIDCSRIQSIEAAKGKPTYDLSGLTVMPG